VAFFIVGVLVGCGEESPTTFADADTMDAADVSTDIRRPTDMGERDAAGRVCTRSSQCDDGIDCTTDFCGGDGRCASVPNHMACDDNTYCNGRELCDLRRGCVRGMPVACNDNYTCTIDRCDESTRSCVHSPRDFDRDGDPDGRCRAPDCPDGGTPDASAPDGGSSVCWVGSDCDDSNPRVNARLPELCGDMIDNNCNGMIDMAEPGGCRRPPHDTCDDALDVSRGGRFTFQTLGTVGNYMFRCAGGMLQRDVVARLTLTEPRDVSITASSSGASVFVQFMQARCGTAMMPTDIRDCVLGFPTQLRQRSLPAGEYFILLGTSSAGTVSELELTVDVTPATPIPTNDTCTSPIVIPPTGGMFRGDLVGVMPNVSTRCGGLQNDVVYAITLPARANITARVAGGRTDTFALALVDRCVASPSTIRCDNAAPAQFTARELNAGTYYLVVAGRSINPYTLEVIVGPPTPPPQGDVCANPIPITRGTMAMGTFEEMEADYQFSCSGTGSRDVVYRFTLTERSDVTATVTGSTSDFYYMVFQSTCGERTNERGCRAGSSPHQLTARGLDPGTYFVAIKSIRGGSYTLSLDVRPPAVVMTAAGNDTCMNALVIPPGGGLYMGNTTMMRHDYIAPCSTGATSEDVVFRYRVERRSRVTFSTDGSSFDTLMWLTSGSMCPGTNVPGGCNDDAIGINAAFTVTLDPGDYHLFIGGFGSTSRGNYVLSVTPMPL
jgi:hypothetical protein